MTYEELIMKHDDLIVIETDLSDVNGLKGLYVDGCIAIDKKLSNVEKGCILAEEIGHHLSTVGNILDQSRTNNRKQELKARLLAFDFQIGLSGIIEAYEAGCTSSYMMADYLNVTESFLHDAIEEYRKKYGICIKNGKYIIYFEPCLCVMKMII